MSLINQLKNEHAAIREGLEKAYELQDDPQSSQRVLNQVKTLLLQHLKREDDDLYPTLERYAAEDKELRSMLDEYLSDMEDVSKMALDFFESVELGALDGFRFAREFGQLSTVLANRIRREEARLYPAFERLGLI